MNSFNVKDISTYFGDTPFLKNISLSVEPGNIVGMIGPNGSGKTTLLKSICCLIPHDGTCGFDTPFEKLNEHKKSLFCTYMPQSTSVTVDLPVLDIVLMAYDPTLGLLSKPTENMKQNAVQILNELGLHDKEHSLFSCLSGGEKKLVLLARSLVRASSLIVMDEPESSLDPEIRVRTFRTIRKYVSSRNSCALISLHDIDLALNYCDSICLMKDGKISGFFKPKNDSDEYMELQLSNVFGNIRLKRIKNYNNREQLTMIREMI